MAWKKSSAALVARFQQSLPDDPRVERRSMFGYPCAFVNGNMFAGLHEERLIVRLPDGRRESLLAEPGASRFEPMPGRVMREYAVVPQPLHDARLAGWMDDAFRHAAALPLKGKRRSAAKKAGPAAAGRKPTRRR